MDKLEQLINNQVKDWSLDQEFYKNKEIFDLEIENKKYLYGWLGYSLDMNLKFQTQVIIFFSICYQNQ